MKTSLVRWVRQNFGFSVSSGILVGFYLVGVTGLAVIFSISIGPHPLVLDMAATVAIAAAMNPARIKFQKFIDRTFFRNTFDYKRSILEFAQTVGSNIHLSQLLQELFRQMDNWMGVPSGLIYLKHSDEDDFYVLDQIYGVSEDKQQLLPAITTNDELFTFLSRGVFLPLETLHVPSRAADVLKKIGIVLVIPFYIKEKLIGVLCLGKKRSKLDYEHDDLQLLSTVTNQCSVAIENAIAYRSIQELNQTLEQRVRTQMEELLRTVEHLKQTQNQLLVSEKMASLGRMITGVIQEVKDPLTVISLNSETFQNYVEMIKNLNQFGEQLESGSPQRLQWDGKKEELSFEGRLKHVEKMTTTTQFGIDRIKKIIADLSQFSRSELEEFRPVNINRVIRQVVAAFEPQKEGSIEFHLDLQPISDIPGLAGQVLQMVYNLIQNAFDAIPERGGIWIETRSEEKMTHLRIRDNGRGISKENLPKIFDPFFTTKKIGQGTGLGLSVVYGIVTKHGGKINIHSEPGEGTTVEIEFAVY